jgi:hypothetical protein
MSNAALSSRTPRGLAVAAAGLFAGHVLVYRILAVRDGAPHAYLPVALVLGLALAAVGGVGAFLLGFRRATVPGARGRRFGLAASIILPAVAQAAAFLALEFLERALAGAPLGSLLGPLLPVGVALQLVVGAIGGLVLAGLDRAGEMAGKAVAARRRRPGRTTGAHPWPNSRPIPKPQPWRSRLTRGPPERG